MEKRKLIVGVAVLAVVLVAAKFGPAPEQKDAGNTLMIGALTPPDSYDPGISYQGASWEFQVNAYNGLLTYRKEEGAAGAELVPDLAEAMPKITNGGRTLTFKMRRGVKFGPPLNREVLPSDLAYTFRRNAAIPCQGNFYYSIIEGFEDYSATAAKTKKTGGSIKGIVADDAARTITFNLTRPDATILYVLALPFSFAVPKGTPPKDLSLDGFIPPTGPYMFSEFDPSRRMVMVRNPAFKQWTPHTPTGKVDKMVLKFKVSEDNAVTLIQQGKLDLAQIGIPRSKLPVIMNDPKWSKHVHDHVEARTAYLWMNTKVPPFDNRKVRQAVNWSINRRALVKLGGGQSQPSSTILPPTMPGYNADEAYPKQDMAKARQLIAESGIEPGEIVLWSLSGSSTDSTVYIQGQLEQLGFKVRTRFLDISAYYGLIGNEETKAQIGTGGWGQDFPEGSNFIDVLLNSKNIKDRTNSPNYAWYDAKDDEIERVKAIMDLDERAKEWGRLDREIVEDGAWAPLSHGMDRSLIGVRVGDYIHHPVLGPLSMRMTVDGSGLPNAKHHEVHEGGDGITADGEGDE